MNRRTLLASLAALVSSNAFSQSGIAQTETTALDPAKVKLGTSSVWSFDGLLAEVKAAAAEDYVEPVSVPKSWVDLTYDQYKNIFFKTSASLWKGEDSAYEVQFFAPGLYFPKPISVAVVEGDEQRPVLFDKDVFRFGTKVPELTIDETLNYSGFRLHAHINSAQKKSEFVVFQGASYFRAIGKDQAYGLSARGLALNTAEPEGEEFPDFRKFWIEKIANGSKQIKVHALLDSPSVTGLYTFLITPGVTTEMAVEAHLFPRKDLEHVGIAAETSMFLFDETNRNRFDDFRPAVHDSDGLLIENGAGETLWRQLANPTTLQVSSFVDDNPRGFGLLQRPRNLADFADLEALYHKRPGLWVTPGENWGKGAVTLVEIPADKEIYDNIVAYWRPRKPLAAGSEHRFTYKLAWCEEPPLDKTRAAVINTRMGKGLIDGRIITIDYAPSNALPDDLDKITIHASSNGGDVSKGVLQRNPATGGLRLAIKFDPEERNSVELRAQLIVDQKQATEVWLYRWTS